MANLNGCYLCGAGMPILKFVDKLYVFRCQRCGCQTKPKSFEEAVFDWEEGHTFPPSCRKCIHGDGSYKCCGKEEKDLGFIVMCQHFEERAEPEGSSHGEE